MKLCNAVKAWMGKHLVLLWAIASIAFAFVIHWLFKTPAPCEFLDADWESGDILTFASTVALGLLAVWQNRKFKEENDEAQESMKNLTSRANELSVISKIIEYESARISQLKTKTQCFIEACNTEGIFDDLSDIANQPSEFQKTFVK